MLSQGHTEAQFYPLGMVQDETGLVQERVNGVLGTEMTITRLAIGSVLSEKLRKSFTEKIKAISVTSIPRAGLFEDE